ncbi:glutamyl-tRNA synthetase [Rhodothalassium salexigens DSM 2132]|uniref:Glutamate--tRNA ligase n=1 Tax=Rhodothalassium salexigens DSM 2132 TaxID=1188247 RepID=A0A4R2PVS6_RHOSA|nr:glutamate--tRNA ligase [Rhodothalassium salexigens]MBB4210086.1 glutamyl-tRNA synthetase [Rhodothalassium salexigens DSM 2132]MBK1639588.1 glutamate--tRNA ligase [Rhodothalassium salexigens DSM 2132]TCP38251.1 glutamyl-tRNA synthetase [Rhodothalassium salexigens DSM 2132]
MTEEQSVVTRFAPSPTGFLHIGGARTALFNWVFARGHGGKFLLRIEDTDLKRSTQEAKDAIFAGLTWLGLDWDGEAVSQASRRDRHAEVAERLLAEGRAYRCYATQDELAAMRAAAEGTGKPWRYDRRWRDRDPAEAPEGVAPVIRFRCPLDGETVIEDAVQGRVTVPNSDLHDLIIMRSDGTPTYMLSVVVDDHDMGVTHVIRGDDHLTNAAIQSQLFQALGWAVPVFAHIPLIHGPDGKKLSKRHGALGVEAYRDMGFLPEAMRNYLMRLGWGHGDMEVFSSDEAQALFRLDAIGRGAARFDTAKLESLNAHYIKASDDDRLLTLVTPSLEAHIDRKIDDRERTRLTAGMAGLKERAKTLVDLAQAATVYTGRRPLSPDDKAARQLDDTARAMLGRLIPRLDAVETWDEDALGAAVRAFAEEEELKVGKVAPAVRAAVTGTTVSPSVFQVLAVFGREETLARLRDAAAG